ncbi:MAG TPA: undecaprenyl-diphosphatase UppP [Candidatus Saccharimonadales bacterium]|nr:undecaprenyl-diphosphatase UppP [Candidatus Saccharimonadales bacterium]
MEIFQALILGLVQGASEFLPISSSGHLILVPYLFNWHGVVDSLAFDVALHLGTAVAVVAFFWKDWIALFGAFFKTLPKGTTAVWNDTRARLLSLIIIGSIPAAIIGFFFDKYVESYLREPLLVAVLLIIFSFVLFWADRRDKGDRAEKDLNLVDSILVGLAQCLALFPGVSRSGVTITTGLFRGLDRVTATRFSFLLSTPVIVGAGAIKLKEILHGSLAGGSGGVFLVGMVSAAISGFIAIKFLLRYVAKNNFNIFVIYRIVVGVSIILLVLFRG